MVIGNWGDESGAVGFHVAELERLVGLPLLSRGPVILRPRHLWNLVTNSWRRTAV